MQGRLDTLQEEKTAAQGRAAKDKVQKKIQVLKKEISNKEAKAAKL
jgi:hypothetical protein